MNRTEKQKEIDVLKDKFSRSFLTIITDYKGMKVNDFNEFRRKLREKDATLSVVKNRLAKIAIQGTPYEFLSKELVGTSAVTFIGKDPVGPTKVLVDFAKKHEALRFKIASLNGKSLSNNDIDVLAKLPSREELIAQMLGSMMAPARNLVSVLAQIPRQVVNVLAQVRDKKEKEGQSA